MSDAPIKAVLGPTNTGKTHLAIERMCGHSSGMIGFPLRLLAREVYDRVVAIKGEKQVALITGEERIEPPTARYFLCTAEAMDRTGGGHAFVALDEAQLAADRERGHIFTDRLLHARGREETMLMGAATLAPLVRSLIPQAEITERPRFSTLTHIGPRKLSRLPPRSAIVAFSSEGVYTAAEMLRRYRGGAAVVMGALSPETRNRQVELFQSGEVDYIVATDAIGMGLNLDLNHVAFAQLTKFDGVAKRRLSPAEMAQIAGRAGRHQRDGTFGVLGGGLGGGPGGGQSRGTGRGRGAPLEFEEEEIYAIEENQFAPLTHLYWRNAQPRFDSLPVLIADLEMRPPERELRAAPEAIDLVVLKKLADEPLGHGVKGAGQVRRFWEACSLPDFRQAGADQHARFVARLWRDLQGGYIGADFVAARIAELDNVSGDIATLQGRIAAIRSWAYICQRPDWVLARDEMASRARGAEARLSDALHARLTERFVNRRTAILMKNMGEDPSLLPVTLDDDGTLRVEDESIGRIEGFRFVVDTDAGHDDRRMLLAAGEKALPRILSDKADALVAAAFEGAELVNGEIRLGDQKLAVLDVSADPAKPRLAIMRELDVLPGASKAKFAAALQEWAEKQLAPLEPLSKLVAATRDPDAGSQARALLHSLVEGHGYCARENAGIQHLPKEMRPFLRRLGVTFGALDIFSRDLLKPAPRAAMHAAGIDRRALEPAMRSVLPGEGKLPSGYRPAGEQYVRIDVAEKILRAAHEARAKAKAGDRKGAVLDPALPVSTGLTPDSWHRLLGAAGFRLHKGKALPEGAFGPPLPDRWSWRPGGRTTARPAKGGRPNTGRVAGEKRGKRPQGKKPAGRPQEKRPPRDNPSAPATGKAFAGLADLMKP